MYYQNYEDYMRAVLGYPTENRDIYQMNYFDEVQNNIMPYQNTKELENCYPEIYRIINPIVCEICDKCNVPITRDVVENMVEHGCDENGCRTGKLRIFEDNKYLNIIVENKGNLTDVDKAKIESLLSDNDTDSKLKNIGIKNVNLRLKMLYGEYSGLTITNPEDGITESKVLIEKRKLDGIV